MDGTYGRDVGAIVRGDVRDPTQFATMIALRSLTHDNGWTDCPNSKIAELARQDERTIRRVLGVLVASGHVTREDHAGKRSRYRVNVVPIHPGSTIPPDTSTPDRRSPPPRIVDPPTPDRRSPPAHIEDRARSASLAASMNGSSHTHAHDFDAPTIEQRLITPADVEQRAWECLPPHKRRGHGFGNVTLTKLAGLIRSHGVEICYAMLAECGDADMPIAMLAKRLGPAPPSAMHPSAPSRRPSENDTDEQRAAALAAVADLDFGGRDD